MDLRPSIPEATPGTTAAGSCPPQAAEVRALGEAGLALGRAAAARGGEQGPGGRGAPAAHPRLPLSAPLPVFKALKVFRARCRSLARSLLP